MTPALDTHACVQVQGRVQSVVGLMGGLGRRGIRVALEVADAEVSLVTHPAPLTAGGEEPMELELLDSISSLPTVTLASTPWTIRGARAWKQRTPLQIWAR